MAEIVGIRFKEVGKVYYFDPDGAVFNKGDFAIVETVRGIECGEVAIENKNMDESELVKPLKKIVRAASPEDIKKYEANKKKEIEAAEIARKRIEHHKLEMNLVDVEYTFDGGKILFYFTADGRVDFRELVKDLASIFRTRIELRQIGVRDETKLRGGIGICGRELCCHTYLSDFIPVSVKMAKEQNLSLNPTKISGNCGRLMCCLKHEEDAYEYLNSKLPNLGDTVRTPDGLSGEVEDLNVLKQKVKVLVHVNGADGDEKEIREYPVAELKFKPRKQRRESKEDAAEMKALRALE